MKFIVKDTPEIIYLDNHLLAVDKPHGLLTQPSPECNESLESWAKEFLKRQFDKKGNVFLEACHRLDKVASGIVLFARTSKALSRIQESLRKKEWKKTYIAQVSGHFEKKEGLLEDYLMHHEFRAGLTKDGKKAILTYKVIDEDQKNTLLEIDLETGRYHQIRVQLASRGHPIVGDFKYGSLEFFTAKGIALRQVTLQVPHPINSTSLLLKSR